MSAPAGNIAGFLRWLETERGLSFTGYEALWRWSTDDLAAFWSAVWEYYGLDAVSHYDEVLADAAMPGATWFTGARLNFARQCLAHATDARPALIAVSETGEPVETSWDRLADEVAGVAAALREMGVGPGDCVAGYLPNIPQAVVALLATAAVGATWTVCSPDFGTPSVIARLRQARPTVLVAADGYRYGGRSTTGARTSRRSWTACPRSAIWSPSTACTCPGPVRPGRGGRMRPGTGGPNWPTAGPGRSSPTSRSTTRCGSCGPRGPPACRRASCTATAA